MEAFRRKNLDAALAQAGSNPALQIEAFLDAHLDLAAIDPDALAAWTAMGTEALRDDDVGDRFRSLLHGSQRRLVTILEQGVEEAAFVPMNPQAVAAALIALIQGFFFVASTTSGLIPKGSAAPSARRMARALLLDPPAIRRQGP
jgi:TetR/AcrR family transcriptional repressor of bet genes